MFIFIRLISRRSGTGCCGCARPRNDTKTRATGRSVLIYYSPLQLYCRRVQMWPISWRLWRSALQQGSESSIFSPACDAGYFQHKLQ